MSEEAILRGPKIQRDIALLIRLLKLVDNETEPRSAKKVTMWFVEEIGGYESCDCSSCDSLISSSKTTAAILLPHIKEIINGGEEVYSKVYYTLEKYLMSCEGNVFEHDSRQEEWAKHGDPEA